MMEQQQPKPSPSPTSVPTSEDSVTAAAVVKSSEEEDHSEVVAPIPNSSEPTSPIFHVLLLPGGNIQKLDSDGAGSSNNANGKEGGPAVIIDDYLYQRHVYRRKKKLKKLQPQNNNHQRGGNSDNKNNNNNGSSSDDNNDGEISLKVLASPLEIALVSCCVRPSSSSKQSAEEGGGQNQHQNNEGTSQQQQQQQQTQRSRLHRPILPSNAEEDDDNELLDTPRNIPMRDTTTTANNDNNNNNGGEVGTLQHGRETHFLKLLQMYCHPQKELLMCRALAVQILQRTVDWEKMCDGSGSNTASSGEGEEKESYDHHRVADDSSAATAADEPLTNDKSSSITSTKQRKNHTVMKTFLAIGGMKLLARWLVESYTVIHPQSSPTSSSSSSNKKKQQHNNPNTTTVLPSVTGSLLLPLLTLLKSIPFNKEIIIASQIHKYIKRYKKALLTVMSSNKSMMMSNVDGVEIVHPIAGGGGSSVNQVMDAVDEVMNEWNNATKNSSSNDDDNGNDDDDETNEKKMIDPYKSLRDQLQSRFDELAAFHNHRTNPPEWIPKAVLGVVMASPSPNLSSSPTSTTTTNNNSSSSAPTAAMKPNPALATKNNTNNEWGTNRASASQIARERFLEGFRKQKEAVASSSSSGLAMPPEKRQKIANATTAGGDATTTNNASSNKKVCWVDKPFGRKGVSPQPLHIERVFVKEEEYVAGDNEVENLDVEMFGEEEEGGDVNDEEGVGGEGLPIVRQQQQQDDTVTTGEDDVVMMEETHRKEDDEVDSDLDDMF